MSGVSAEALGNDEDPQCSLASETTNQRDTTEDERPAGRRQDGITVHWRLPGLGSLTHALTHQSRRRSGAGDLHAIGDVTCPSIAAAKYLGAKDDLRQFKCCAAYGHSHLRIDRN